MTLKNCVIHLMVVDCGGRLSCTTTETDTRFKDTPKNLTNNQPIGVLSAHPPDETTTWTSMMWQDFSG
jgi:hypothetical protein